MTSLQGCVGRAYNNPATSRASGRASQIPRRFAPREASADEAVTHAVDRDDVLGLGRVALDLLAQRGHVHVDGARLQHAGIAPDVLEQLAARDERPAVFDEVAQQLEIAR